MGAFESGHSLFGLHLQPIIDNPPHGPMSTTSPPPPREDAGPKPLSKKEEDKLRKEREKVPSFHRICSLRFAHVFSLGEEKSSHCKEGKRGEENAVSGAICGRGREEARERKGKWVPVEIISSAEHSPDQARVV